MRELIIYLRPFYNSDCYKSSPAQTNLGVQIHSTGANNPWLHRYVQPDDGRIGLNKYNNDHNRPGGNVCAGAYIGKQSDGTAAVYQVLPINKRPWLSGSGNNGNANHFMFGFEICEDKLDNIDYFNAAVKTVSVNYAAWLCIQYGVKPHDLIKSFKDGRAICAISDHRDLHNAGCASNHGDIYTWLHKFGYNMNDYRAWVQDAIDEGINVTFIDCDKEVPAMYNAKVTCTGKYLNLRIDKNSEAKVLDTMPKGSIVEVLDDKNNNWWRVRYNGTSGYAMCKSSDGVIWLTKIEDKNPVVIIPDDQNDDAPTDYNGDLVNALMDAKLKLEKANEANDIAIAEINKYLMAIGGE